jgi:hypothetical protein
MTAEEKKAKREKRKKEIDERRKKRESLDLIFNKIWQACPESFLVTWKVVKASEQTVIFLFFINVFWWDAELYVKVLIVFTLNY